MSYEGARTLGRFNLTDSTDVEYSNAPDHIVSKRPEALVITHIFEGVYLEWLMLVLA